MKYEVQIVESPEDLKVGNSRNVKDRIRSINGLRQLKKSIAVLVCYLEEITKLFDKYEKATCDF